MQELILGRRLFVGFQILNVGQPTEPGAAADRVNGIGLPGREVSVVAAAAELGCSALEVICVGQPTTEEWAQSHGISITPTPPLVDGYDEPCPLTAGQIATRTVILQGVVAVASGVEPEPVAEWYQDQGVWESVTPKERAFLLDPSSVGQDVVHGFQWRKEAEWALLWTIHKIEVLGLPIRQCDTRRLVAEIVPALGSDIGPFLTSAVLRPPSILLAEENRHYDLWCLYFQTKREGAKPLPRDLNVSVLYQRQYAFEWMHGIEAWDDVKCDA